MLTKFPKDDERYQWTNHVKGKMLQYGISSALIKRIIKSPQRLEEGIALETIAAMQKRQSASWRKRPQEIWVMYKLAPKIKVISTWRYPGVSPVGKKIYIPEDVWEELAKN